jgi:hypothetical protein
MNGERAGIFDTEDELDVSGFAPKSPGERAARPEQVRAVSEVANFRSREARPPVPKPIEAMTEPVPREPRRYRTGRNTQLNIKARAEVIEAFYTLADRGGWVLGEAFEHAVAALERNFAGQK